MSKKKKLILWGYSQPDDTFHYIQMGLKKAFDFLGYNTYFFDDKNYPEDFDYSDAIFFTEGYADKNIPIRKDCTYFVHVCVEPEKYLNGKVKKLIDVRYLLDFMDEDNYNFILDRGKCEVLDKGVLWEKGNDLEYEVIYMCWATNLLPEEINLDWAKEKRDKTYYFAGSLSSQGRFANFNMVNEFVGECRKGGIDFKYFDPWKNPVPESEHRELITKSYLSPDFRNEQHKDWGYIACRLMKSISYGQIGMTNCIKNADFIHESFICHENPTELFYLGQDKMDDYRLIQEQMNVIKKEHTFVNRARGLEKIL